MRYNSVLPALALAAFADGAAHTVLVGNGGLVYSPNSITAAMGDTVEFSFVRFPHSVVQGSFASPCQPSDSSAFFSGTIKQANQSFTITVNSTDPMYFYCSVGDHCQNGMVGAINAPSGMSASDFAMAASSAQGNSGAPAQVQGGAVSSGVAASSTASTGSASAQSSSVSMTGSSGVATTASSSTAATSGSSTAASKTTSGQTTASTTQTVSGSSTSPTKGAADQVSVLGHLAVGLPVLVMALAY